MGDEGEFALTLEKGNEQVDSQRSTRSIRFTGSTRKQLINGVITC